MKILIISDQKSPALYEHFSRDHFQDIDFVVSCGDLPKDYLEYVVSVLNVPCFFVPGNHDISYVDNPPRGWINLDGKVIAYEGITIMGLGGSMKYKQGPFLFSEVEMKQRYMKLKPKIWWKKSKIDIFAAHSPAFQLGDMEDIPHKGYKIFRDILDRYEPKYFLHGHVHLNYSGQSRVQAYNRTTIINGFQHHIFEY